MENAPKTKKGKLTFFLCFFMSTWIMSFACIYCANPDDSAWFWWYLSMICFLPVWPVLMHFLAVLAELDKKQGYMLSIGFSGKYKVNLNKWTVYLIVQYIVSIVFFIWLYTGKEDPLEFVSTPFGLCYIPSEKSSFYTVFLLFTTLCYITSVYFVLRFRKNSKRKNISIDVKKQAKTITVTSLVFGTCAVFVNIFLPIFKVNFPPIGPLFICVWIACIALATSRYNLVSESEKIIGQKAFDLTNEPMFVTNPDFEILYMNNACKNIFVKPDTQENTITDLIRFLFCQEDLISISNSNGEFKMDEIPFLNAENKKQYFNITASCIYTDTILDRILFVLSDITGLKTQNDELELLVEKRTAEIRRQLEITGKYTRPSLVKIISDGGDPTCLKPENKDMVMLFADIRNFTHLSEGLSPNEVIEFLNQYFVTMNKCIITYHGEIDKLMGDGIMALFESADDAVNAAIEMMKQLEIFNSTQTLLTTKISHGIGINYGNITRGNIGSPEKLDYTIVGDPVNIASRFEQLTKYYKVPVIVSGELISKLTQEHKIRFVDTVFVKGKDKPVNMYEIYDFNTEEQIEVKNKMQSKLNDVFLHYVQGEFSKACCEYEKLNHMYGALDPLLGVYHDRCRELCNRNTDFLDRWTGMYQFTNKNMKND